ncbi:uncharacterized protein [Watersipora subatra]|uniref:uncharacterized protein n=1 Tax=Watersipora subatra TaxID=2589382 RepID=UPI00355C5139
MAPNALFIGFLVDVLLVTCGTTRTLAPFFKQQQKRLSCEDATNSTSSCLNDEIESLHFAAAGVHGSTTDTCSPLINEQMCHLCRRFRKSKKCLGVLQRSCTYSERLEILKSEKFRYLATVASFCSTENVLDEIYDNRQCYNSIAANLRKCFEPMKESSCRVIQRGFKCATVISEALCASLFTSSEKHKKLSALYLRTLQPSIDLQNCSDDSEIALSKIYPEYVYRWSVTKAYPLPVRQLTDSLPTNPSINFLLSAALPLAMDPLLIALFLLVQCMLRCTSLSNSVF